MGILSILRKSAILPKKDALFWLNRVSMRDTLVYLFLLFFIVFLPNVIIMIAGYEQGYSQVSYSQYLLQIIVFYPFFMMFLVVTSISALALGSLLFRWILQRKLAYQQLWKMTAFALLWPLLSYQVLYFISKEPTLAFLLCAILLYIIVVKMILNYPKRKK
ncbi:DUF1189 domain-containing protein [Gracilibacillus salinarum]|uniref:DUF1189 domain-containing protein n=1 Tax=Gracilibacillus salinarum TaxID=2932255 RepID=A0ABY4GR40_9BACI|nr:DUF1189 domain-containing protein [Gracilibacillus salinarum]UOQ86739.1 DUF1189 domain-containing protein [Gracilibacillus salinarum]